MAETNRNLFNAFPTLEQYEADEHYCVNDRDLNKCTGKQRAYIHGLLDKAHMDEEELFQSLGIDAETLKDFTIENAGEAIDYLKSELGWN